MSKEIGPGADVQILGKGLDYLKNQKDLSTKSMLEREIDFES